MSFKINDIFRIFRKLDGSAGFAVKIREGRDTLAKVYYSGRPLLYTKVSHGRGKLDGKVIHFIRNQLGLDESEFCEIIRCTLSAADYKEILKKKGIL